MSYLLGLDVTDQEATTQIVDFLKFPSVPFNEDALAAAVKLQNFFREHGEHIIFGPINEPGYIRRDPDLNTPIGAHDEIEQTEPILAESIYVPPSPEQIIADHPKMHSLAVLEEALRVLRDHILTQPDIARK